jgi:hypothetical protein
MLLAYEGSVQPYLDGAGPVVPDASFVGCAYRKSSPSILVMQSTQDRTAQNAPRCLGGT